MYQEAVGQQGCEECNLPDCAHNVGGGSNQIDCSCDTCDPGFELVEEAEGIMTCQACNSTEYSDGTTCMPCTFHVK